MQGAFGFDAAGIRSALAVGEVLYVHFLQAPFRIHDMVDITNDVGGFQPDGFAGGQAEPFFVGFLFEVVPFHPQSLGKRHLPAARFRIFRVVL